MGEGPRGLNSTCDPCTSKEGAEIDPLKPIQAHSSLNGVNPPPGRPGEGEMDLLLPIPTRYPAIPLQIACYLVLLGTDFGVAL